MAVNCIFYQPWPGSRDFPDYGIPQCSMGRASWGTKHRRQPRPRGVYLKVYEENMLLEH